MELKIAVCDDDAKFVTELSNRLEKILKDSNIRYDLNIFTNGEDMVKCGTSQKFDIILTDIDMPHMNGYEAIGKLKKIEPATEVIFVTAHMERIYESYDYHPYCYVVKSDLERLDKNTVNLARKIIAGKKTKNKILYFEGDVSARVGDIEYISSQGNYVIIHEIDGTTKKSRGTLKTLYNSMMRDYDFVYPQRGYLINCRYITDIKNKVITLNSGLSVPMTRNKKKAKEVQDTIFDYIRRESL